MYHKLKLPKSFPTKAKHRSQLIKKKKKLSQLAKNFSITKLLLDDSITSMPALARQCTSGVETSKHMQVTCWHCGCWDHYECVDNQYLSPYRTGGKWLPWFLRKSRPFIFKYRPLGPTYFNIWGIFTIVGIFLIKWYNIPLMQFVSLTLEGAHS